MAIINQALCQRNFGRKNDADSLNLIQNEGLWVNRVEGSLFSMIFCEANFVVTEIKIV